MRGEVRDRIDEDDLTQSRGRETARPQLSGPRTTEQIERQIDIRIPKYRPDSVADENEWNKQEQTRSQMAGALDRLRGVPSAQELHWFLVILITFAR